MTTEAEEDLCSQCGDPFGLHALIPTHEQDPLHGGIMLCPRPGCQCFITWDASHLGGWTRDQVVVPDRAEIETMRELIQAA